MKLLVRANAGRVFRGLGVYVTLILIFAFSTIIALGATGGAAVGVAHYGSDTIQVIFNGFSNFIHLPLAIAIFVSGALFTYGAIANELAFGLSRAKIYFSHLLLGSVLCVVLVFVFIAWSVILGTVINGFGSVPQGFWLKKQAFLVFCYCTFLRLVQWQLFLFLPQNEHP